MEALVQSRRARETTDPDFVEIDFVIYVQPLQAAKKKETAKKGTQTPKSKSMTTKRTTDPAKTTLEKIKAARKKATAARNRKKPESPSA